MHMTNRLLASGAALAAGLLMSALAVAAPTGAPAPVAATPMNHDKAAPLSDKDVQVLSELHATNQMEIEMGKLAKAHGGKAVKQFGQLMISDHGKADKDVLALAKAHGATLADHPTPADDAEKAQMEKDMAAMERLKTLDGTAFDTEYLTAMIDGHTRTLAKVDAAMMGADDGKLKVLLGKVKPVVQKHLDRAKTLSNTATAAAR
jgi:putative membrane protein